MLSEARVETPWAVQRAPAKTSDRRDVGALDAQARLLPRVTPNDDIVLLFKFAASVGHSPKYTVSTSRCQQ